MKDDELNTLIDDVARQMTAGEPAASFTSDVLARLESEERPVRSWRPLRSWRPVGAWRPALAGLAAAAALLVLAVVYRGHSPTEPGTSTVRLPSTMLGPGKPDTTGQIAAGPKEPAPQFAEQAGPHRLRQGYGGPPKRSTKEEGPARPIANPIPSDIDALTIPSIAVAAIADTPLPGPELIQSDPLTIAPLTVTPIDGADDSQRRFE